MEQLQSFLNFTNANGEVITVLDGKFTLSQVVIFIVGILFVLLVLKFVKGVIKTIATICILITVCLYFNIASPEDFTNVANIIKEQGIETYMSYVDASENIKVEDNQIFILVNETWINVSEITSAVNCMDGKTIIVGDQSYVVEDEQILDLLDNLQ